MIRILLVAFAALASASSASAQSFTGTIVGTIRDTSQAVVPGAEITIVNVNTNLTESTTADAAGRCQLQVGVKLLW